MFNFFRAGALGEVFRMNCAGGGRPMPLKMPLNEVVTKVPGAVGAILADWEGEAVEQVGLMDSYELKVVGAYHGVILGLLRQISDRLDREELREIIVTTTQAQILVLPVSADYFLVLVLKKDAILGKALFEARGCVSQLKAEVD